MISPAFKIFRVSPVMGIRGMRSTPIHLPFALREASILAVFRNTRTV
jgi:hypothetical protein